MSGALRLSRTGTVYRKLRKLRSRVIIASKRLAYVDATAYIHPTSHVASDLRAGPFVFVGRHCSISPGVTIGKYTMVASFVAIVGADHKLDVPGRPMQFTGRPAQPPTNIGADVWLGHGVIVMRGIAIGDGAVVAAGAVVTKDVPSYEIWAGVPASRLAERFPKPADRALHESMLAGGLLAPRFAERQEGT